MILDLRRTCKAICKVREHSTKSPSLLIPFASSEVPKTTLSFDIHEKESQNSLKLLSATVYYTKRIQITISQRKRCMEQSPGKFKAWTFRASYCRLVESWIALPFLATMYETHRKYCQPRKPTRALMSRDFIGHVDLVGYLIGWPQSLAPAEAELISYDLKPLH